MANQHYVVGIDVGGTNLRFALVGADGEIVARRRIATPMNRAAFLSKLNENVGFMATELSGAGSLTGVGIGMPGLIAPSGQILSSVNLQHCAGLNLESELQAVTGLPVAVVNDANAAACGEHRFGAGRPFRTFIMITIGTGIGGGLVLDGNLWTGVDGFAGEFGHLTVVPDGRACPCGNHGCVEQYSSATALLAIAGEQGIMIRDASVEALAALATAGDAQAIALFRDAGRYLGAAAAAVVNLLNPAAIIIGGGVAASFALMQSSMRAEIDLRAYRPSAAGVTIIKGELNDDAGVLGAAAVALERFSR
ncbi:ROK family protein [Geobacter pelophilus]|uniref:ROK family protein n=1 Tax=Geoanaerobacter pelophilus TaxID=60036 RepID=A0AAW4L4P4_9BACT|nr:ROK family protein [Geoanaerobacter pelophilus]